MSSSSISAVSFYTGNNATQTAKLALKFAGKNGRLATIPDILRSRMNNSGDRSYYTTSSSEFYGKNAHGVLTFAVLHGTGPLVTPSGMNEAYKHEYLSDDGRFCTGGQIPRSLFLEILEGKHGDVFICPAERVFSSAYQYVFGNLTVAQLMDNPLFIARMGGMLLAEQYLNFLDSQAHEFLIKNGCNSISEQRLSIRMEQIINGDGSYGTYASNEHLIIDGTKIPKLTPKDVGDDIAYANLLSISQYYIGSVGYSHNLQFEISPHEWSNGVRFVGIRDLDGEIIIREPRRSIDMSTYEKFSVQKDAPKDVTDVFVKINFLNSQPYAEIPKKGSALDSGAPQHPVKILKTIGDPTPLMLPITGYHGIFRYSIKDVQIMAPESANAYNIVGNVGLTDDNSHHVAMIQFYRVSVDYSVKFRTEKDMLMDMDVILNLIE